MARICVNSISIVSKVVDNPRWCAPESMFSKIYFLVVINFVITVIKKAEYDEKSDVYSFGIVLWEVIISFPLLKIIC
jgi:serine/threonine protein kinase